MKLFLTDFDGTLRRSDGTFSETDLAAIHGLRDAGVVTAIATGRNLYSFKKSGGMEIPVDYVIFSTGAGIIDRTDGSLIYSMSIDGDATKAAARALIAEDLDFMVHRPVPENHHFRYRPSGNDRGDFRKRIDLYRDYAEAGSGFDDFGASSQLIAIIDGHDGYGIIERLRASLPGMNIIRTTSPLDGVSGWIEIFPGNVSKGHATAWLAGRLGVTRENAAGVGNDYNDVDMLEWTGSSFMTANAPEDIKGAFAAVPSHDECGVAAAIRAWMG